MRGRPSICGCVLFAMLVAGTTTAWADQQSPAFPPIEFGVQVAGIARADGPSGVVPGVNVSWNLDRLTAIDFAADFQPRRSSGARESAAQRLFLVEVRRSLVDHGDTRLFGLIGAGAGTRDYAVSPYTYGPYYFPGFTRRDGIGAFDLGIGVERRLASHLALRAETTFILSNISADLRAGIGVSVPVGRFAPAPAEASVMPAGFQLIHTGQRVWVTTRAGQVRMGTVTAMSATSLTLRQRDGQTEMAASEIRRIDGDDSIKNGAIIGAGVGAGIIALPVLAAIAEDGSDDGEVFVFALVWGGIGAGMGAVLGAVIDSFHEGRRTLYEDTNARSFSVAPIVTRKGAGLGGTITWR